MKNRFYILALLTILIAGCAPTRIVTVSSHAGPMNAYTTTVTIPKTHTQTTTARVVATSEDISLYLDLQAVAAAFAQSATIEQFEDLLNDASYMLSNLDLNRDGYVDYLRVMETMEGRNHVFVIQAVLAPNIYQDVATLVAEVNTVTTSYVQIIGAPYIYGPNYIIEPVYYTRPLIFAHLVVTTYRPWRSPWYWDHFPAHYRHPKPIYVSHYQAYVETYMRNHRYCHEFHYAPKCHFPDYDRMSRDLQRNDYGKQHPEEEFSRRNANVPAVNNTRVVNARDIRERQQASSVTNTIAPATNNTRRTAATTATPTRSASTATRTTTSGSNVRNAATTSSASRTGAGTSRSASSTAAKSTTGTSGSTATRNVATPSGTSTTRSASGTTSGTAVNRSAASGSTSTARTATGSANNARTTSSGSTSRASQTTVSSRVSNSGSTDTRISTKSASGTTSTTKRETGSTSGTVSRSSSPSSTTSSASRSTTTSNTRSTGSTATRAAGSGTPVRR